MDELILSLNLLRERPGKSNRAVCRDYLPHDIHTVCVCACTCSLWCLDGSDQGSNHCGGSHVASGLLVCLLNAPLRQHEKERSGLCFPQSWKKCVVFFFPFRMEHGGLKQTSGKGRCPSISGTRKEARKGRCKHIYPICYLQGKQVLNRH